MRQICQAVGSDLGGSIRELWEEYEAGETAEARLVKEVDKFEAACQAVWYSQQPGNTIDALDVITTSRKQIKNPLLLRLLNTLEGTLPRGLRKKSAARVAIKKPRR